MCETPLAARVLDDTSDGVTFVPALMIAAAGGRRQGLSAAAGETLHQILEQVTSKEHVDPGVTAAVETRQQHCNDESHV